MQNNFQN